MAAMFSASLIIAVLASFSAHAHRGPQRKLRLDDEWMQKKLTDRFAKGSGKQVEIKDPQTGQMLSPDKEEYWYARMDQFDNQAKAEAVEMWWNNSSFYDKLALWEREMMEAKEEHEASKRPGKLTPLKVEDGAVPLGPVPRKLEQIDPDWTLRYRRNRREARRSVAERIADLEMNLREGPSTWGQPRGRPEPLAVPQPLVEVPQLPPTQDNVPPPPLPSSPPPSSADSFETMVKANNAASGSQTEGWDNGVQ